MRNNPIPIRPRGLGRHGGNSGGDLLEQLQSRVIGQPQDVAYAVWFLASRFADYVTGEVLHVDGGFKME